MHPTAMAKVRRMRETRRLESRKKKSRRFYYVIIPAIIVVAAFIFLRNNRELFFSPSEEKKAIVRSVPAPKQSSSPPSVKVEAAVRPEPAAEKSAAIARLDSVTIDDFSCRLGDLGDLGGREALAVVLSLELFFPAGAMRGEVLLKRDDLKVMVRKTIAGKALKEVIVDSLREQTKRAMNKILEKGAITDIRFRQFTIDKVR